MQVWEASNRWAPAASEDMVSRGQRGVYAESGGMVDGGWKRSEVMEVFFCLLFLVVSGGGGDGGGGGGVKCCFNMNCQPDKLGKRAYFVQTAVETIH